VAWTSPAASTTSSTSTSPATQSTSCTGEARCVGCCFSCWWIASTADLHTHLLAYCSVTCQPDCVALWCALHCSGITVTIVCCDVWWGGWCRSGRTARAGAKGLVTSLVGPRDRRLATAIQYALDKGLPLDQVTASGAQVCRTRLPRCCSAAWDAASWLECLVANRFRQHLVFQLDLSLCDVQ
jgi:hypothetical protein